MKRYIFQLLALFLISFSACEDVIDVKLSDENLNLIAVEAKITTEQNPYVYLYRSQKVDEDQSYPGISNALVTFSDNSQPAKSIQMVESTETDGLYLVPENVYYIGEAGKEYTVSIETEGVTFTASDVLYPVEPIDSIQVRASLRGEKRFLGVFTYGNEPQGKGNYYKWDIYIDNNFLNDAEYLFIASDELVDGNYVESLEIFTDFHDYDEREEERLLKLGSEIFVKQQSISEFAYKYYYQMYDQNFSGGLFSVPPANVVGNFTASNGKPVLGIFTAHDVSVSNVVLIDENIESQLDERP